MRASRGASFRVAAGLATLALATILAIFAAERGGGANEVSGAPASGKPGTAGYIVKSNDSVTKSNDTAEVVSAANPTGEDTDEVSTSGAKPIEPCALVSTAEADEILGGGVHVVERPQGPTCIFTGSGRQVSLVVSHVSLHSLVDGARHAEGVSVAGRRGWCVQYETWAVLLSVGSHRILQVTGPCQAGVRFAAVALPRIPS